MKLFHTENGKETVYVQMEDMMRLNQSSIPIPVSIFEKVFTPGIIYVNSSNRFNFVKFDEEHEVDFFREIEFILDYDQYKDLTDEQLDKEGRELTNIKPTKLQKNGILCLSTKKNKIVIL